MYVNKINNKKYIGQAKNFNIRHRQHIYSSYNENDKSYNYTIHKSIRKYGIENFNIIILKENLKSQCLLNLYECYYIKKYNTLAINKNGYNISNGGHNGNCWSGKSDEQINEFKQKMSKIMKEIAKNNNYSIKMKEIAKNNKNHCKNHYVSVETRQKMSNSKKGSNNPKSKKVLQYDLNGNLINIWNCIKDISDNIDYINYSGLRSVLQGKTKTSKYKGFIWKYEEH